MKRTILRHEFFVIGVAEWNHLFSHNCELFRKMRQVIHRFASCVGCRSRACWAAIRRTYSSNFDVPIASCAYHVFYVRTQPYCVDFFRSPTMHRIIPSSAPRYYRSVPRYYDCSMNRLSSPLTAASHISVSYTHLTLPTICSV